MRAWVKVTVGLTVLTLLGSGASWSASEATSASDVGAMLPPAGALEYKGEPCGYCELDCASCDPWSCDEHYVGEDEQFQETYVHECWGPEGCGAHPPCEPTEEDQDFATVADVWEAIMINDMTALRTNLPKAGGGGAVVNVERGSLQIRSCRGNAIVANFPLTEAQVVALVE